MATPKDKINNQNIHFDPYSIPLTNDLFIKFALGGEDVDSQYLRNHLIYVYISNIKKVMKQKEIREMNVLEKFLYILKKNLDDAILKKEAGC